MKDKLNFNMKSILFINLILTNF